MTMVWNQMARLTVVLVLLLGLTLVGPLAASAQNGGNSGAAEACQQGGFASLAPTEDRRTPFVNTGDCVSYAARGGTIVPVLVADFSIESVRVTNDPRGIGVVVTFSGSGLEPGSVVRLELLNLRGIRVEFILNAPDSDGNFTNSLPFGCGFNASLTLTGVADDGTPVSETFAFPC